MARLSFKQRCALVAARDYLLWLVELKGIRTGAVATVRELIDQAIAEDEDVPSSTTDIVEHPE